MGKISNLTNIFFQMGWNHHPGKYTIQGSPAGLHHQICCLPSARLQNGRSPQTQGWFLDMDDMAIVTQKVGVILVLGPKSWSWISNISKPRCSMGIFTARHFPLFMWPCFTVHVGKYWIHGACGKYINSISKCLIVSSTLEPLIFQPFCGEITLAATEIWWLVSQKSHLTPGSSLGLTKSDRLFPGRIKAGSWGFRGKLMFYLF